ncbi:hypothetical protein AYL99_06058 [Fonsecaea erecta]|uniref:Uncharacterized protein n=1 Tax=Fonsecaea erecta TaxID=1367422 RepID=A0A178ZML4_9EURO|nr:hypothetical protein AYL99_06058 [Fonsecaea erecta]OAP61054.1 hypothetical protein AYL99_06058 [Fonsecaea erecta]
MAPHDSTGILDPRSSTSKWPGYLVGFVLGLITVFLPYACFRLYRCYRPDYRSLRYRHRRPPPNFLPQVPRIPPGYSRIILPPPYSDHFALVRHPEGQATTLAVTATPPAPTGPNTLDGAGDTATHHNSTAAETAA